MTLTAKTLGMVLAGVGAYLLLSKPVLARSTTAKALRDRINSRLAGYEPIIQRYANVHSVRPELIKAVIWQESRGKRWAKKAEPRIGDASRGLMQVLYRTARNIGYKGDRDGLFDPDTNIYFGTLYLKRQLDRYNGSIPKAVAAYNAGEARYTNGLFINQGYVDSVLRYYYALR